MARTWTASQEAAITISGKTLLVSAAAGSGKTSVLTERIIRSLLDENHPADLSRLLVVTFTRAAAAELKGRIAAALTDALAERPSDKRLSKQLLMLESAQISTIDSFFQKLVRANFEQLGLPATFRIADASEILPLSTDIMDSLIGEFYERYDNGNTSDSPFARIENNRFAEALDHLMSNRSDGKLNGVLLDYLEIFSSYPEGIELLHSCAQDLCAGADEDFLRSSYGASLADYMKGVFKDYENELLRLQATIEREDPDGAGKCDALLQNDLSFCRAMLTSIQANCYVDLQRTAYSFVGGRFPTVKNKSAAVIAYQEFRTVFRKCITRDIQEKLRFPSEVISQQMHQTADLMQILYHFYKEFQTRLMAEKNLRGILEHNDVRAMLYRLLTNEDGTSSELAESIASQYDAVYIDEYQDVDLLQDSIFARIGGNRRFMVGDIKQSIYGFRGSDPSIFAAYRRAMPLHTDDASESSDGVCVFMSENFRCDPPVIDFANRVCSFLFSACERSVGYRPQDDLVVSKKPAEPLNSEYPFDVQVAVFDRKKDTEEGPDGVENPEAVWVAAEISKLIRSQRLDNREKISPSDIAILVRNRAHGRAFVKELEALNIPVSAENASDTLQEPLFIDLLNLLRAVDNPYRDIPLSEFLISPLGGFTLEELSHIRSSAPDCKALYDALAIGCEEAASDVLREKTHRIFDWLGRLRENASILPADRFLRLLYLDERIIPYANTPALLFLYDQARAYQRTSWCGLFGFLNHFQKVLDGKKVSAAGLSKAESAVTVMTVHHSKGLEFPIVFLCATGASFNRSDTYESLLFQKNVGGAAKLYDRGSGEKQTTILREVVRQAIDDEQTEESIRTLYVALTRARERLYVTGTLAGKWENARSSASMIHRGQRAAILGCNSYLNWILAALQENCVENTEFPCALNYYTANDVCHGTVLCEEKNEDDTPKSAVGAPDDRSLERYAKVLEDHAAFSYPLDFLRGIPTKAAASKLRGDLLDVITDAEHDEDVIRTQIALMEGATPSFERLLSEHEKPSASDIGTATHTFLHFCDFERLMTSGVDAECERLKNQAFMTEESLRIVNREQLSAFCKSDLMRWILDAAKIRREQKFSLFVPLSDLTNNQMLAKQTEGHTLFVQGSIDLLLENTDGSLTLIDYKTDHIRREELADRALLTERMRKRHGEQLACYAKAVEQLFGRRPDNIYLYSIPLGEAILMS